MNRWWWLLVLLVLVAGSVVSHHKGTSELPVYTTGAERMLEGEEVYRTGDEKQFTYPPFFGLPFVPFAWIPDVAHRTVWFLINAAVLAWIVWSLHRLVGPWLRQSGRRAWVFWVLLVLLAGRHVSSVFENQSHDLVVFAFLVAAARSWGRRREAAAGMWAGVGTACKATPLFAATVFAGALRPLALLVLIGTAVVATLLPDVVLPRDDGRMWAAAWYDTYLGGLSVGGTAEGDTAWSSHSVLNQSLSGTMTRLFWCIDSDHPFFVDACLVDLGEGGRKVATLLAQAAVGLAVVLAAFRARRWNESDGARELRRWGEMGAVGCGMVLLSPMSSKAHFCVLLLPVAWCLLELMCRRPSPVAGVLLAVSFATGSLTVKGIVGREAGNVLLAYGTVTWSTVAVLVATLWLLFRRPREDA